MNGGGGWLSNITQQSHERQSKIIEPLQNFRIHIKIGFRENVNRAFDGGRFPDSNVAHELDVNILLDDVDVDDVIDVRVVNLFVGVVVQRRRSRRIFSAARARRLYRRPDLLLHCRLRRILWKLVGLYFVNLFRL